ncbi:hypothetical protein NP233_g6819 [Leucocoprinus birnbaumii]|uniref:Uncharacterized protein n=1 Tax=Leucocoprinus birnbaumii TaxID=56174 RepID=A0AAD5YV71_9AGAR|nr:hypothetical protein NP233_g6819 [Leucocoprinus birnbaumii]
MRNHCRFVDAFAKEAILSVRANAIHLRKEPPQMPSLTVSNRASDPGDLEGDFPDDVDDNEEQDWDMIDDSTWKLVLLCLVPEPSMRPDLPAIQHDIRKLILTLNPG